MENTKFKKGERTDNSQIAKCYSDKFLIKFEGEKIEQFKEENCSKCNKDIDCKITQDINGKLKCTED